MSSSYIVINQIKQLILLYHDFDINICIYDFNLINKIRKNEGH